MTFYIVEKNNVEGRKTELGGRMTQLVGNVALRKVLSGSVEQSALFRESLPADLFVPDCVHFAHCIHTSNASKQSCVLADACLPFSPQ